MIRKIIAIIALASCFHTTFPMLVKSNKELTKYNQKQQEQNTAKLFTFVENSPKRVQDTILNNLEVESKSDYDKALSIGANRRSRDVQNLGVIFALTSESREVLASTNTHFDSTGKRKINLSRDQYNALAAVPFIIRKNYYNDQGRFLKAVVQADLYTQLMRVTASTAIGVVGGVFVGGAYAAGVSYGENLQQSHANNLEQHVTIFNQKYHDTYGPTFKETYAETVREKAGDDNTVTTEITKNLKFEHDADYKNEISVHNNDPMGREIFQGAGQLVNAQRSYQEQMKRNPEYVKEQALINRTVDIEAGGQSIITEETATFGIGTIGGFVQGIFKNSFHKHHEAAIEYGVQAAASAALSAALSAVQAIGAPIMNSDVSWDDVKDSAKTVGVFGGFGGFFYGIWNRNEPIKKKDIAKMNKPI